MPDDTIESQIAEQQPAAPPAGEAGGGTPDPPEQEVDEASAFLEDDPPDDNKDGEDEKPAQQAKDDGGLPDADVQDDDDPDDEDLQRGKEILEERKQAIEAEEAAKKEAQAQEAAQKAGSDQTQGQDDGLDVKTILNESFDDRVIKDFILPSLPKNLFPTEPIVMDDGTALDFQAVINDIPELPAMIMMVANNMVRQMAATGYLVQGDKFQRQVQEYDQTVNDRLWESTITHPEYGVPNAKQIVESEGFQKWYEKQPDAIAALFASNNPYDRIKGLKRYVNQGVLGEASRKKQDADAKRKANKAVFDAVYKPSKRAASSRPGKSAMSPQDEELAAFMSDDEE